MCSLFMLRKNFCILFFLVICNIFVLFNFVLFEDYALQCIYYCTTLRHAVAYLAPEAQYTFENIPEAWSPDRVAVNPPRHESLCLQTCTK
jgi:hypothetical protein